MNLTTQICMLSMLLLGVWALIGCKDVAQDVAPRQASKLASLKSFKSMDEYNDDDINGVWETEGDGDDEWESRLPQHISIQMTNLEEEEQKEREKDHEVKQALLQMMKLKDTKIANRHQERIDNVPGLDFRREFASDEANPYI